VVGATSRHQHNGNFRTRDSSPKGKIQSVHLCFTTDPFMCGYEEIKTMSLTAIEKLNASGIKCTVLTKGLLPIELARFLPEMSTVLLLYL